jgi:hypothetical protein
MTYVHPVTLVEPRSGRTLALVAVFDNPVSAWALVHRINDRHRATNWLSEPRATTEPEPLLGRVCESGEAAARADEVIAGWKQWAAEWNTEPV